MTPGKVVNWPLEKRVARLEKLVETVRDQQETIFNRYYARYRRRAKAEEAKIRAAHKLVKRWEEAHERVMAKGRSIFRVTPKEATKLRYILGRDQRRARKGVKGNARAPFHAQEPLTVQAKIQGWGDPT